MRELLALAALFLAPNILRAQERGGPGTPPLPDAKQMYEDIEIMRQILLKDLFSSRRLVFAAKACERCHFPNIGTFSDLSRHAGLQLPEDYAHTVGWFLGQKQRDPHGDLATVAAPEGIYLKGHGVLFSLTLPSSPG